jgi:hypothetical protein
MIDSRIQDLFFWPAALLEMADYLSPYVRSFMRFAALSTSIFVTRAETGCFASLHKVSQSFIPCRKQQYRTKSVPV